MSQLHKRLQHLVQYSSQLIFVSSDSIADQQRSLTEFLSLQHETTEVSFFTADNEQSNSDYRRIICRQLANHSVGSFVRSLKDLLHDLNPDQGQFLVCIAQAQCLDKDFVEELWQWISTCRQRHDGLHVNVILFAEQAWTEKMQAWLPAHNENNPVLLSSQSVDVVGFDVSALESLMAQKRAFFSADTAHNIIRKKWFIAAVLIAFLAIFVSLMAVQYPAQVRYFLSHGKFPEQSDVVIEPVSELSANSAEDFNENKIEDSFSPNTEYKAKIELVEPDLTDSLLVTTWPKEDQEQSLSEPEVEPRLEEEVQQGISSTATKTEAPPQTIPEPVPEPESEPEPQQTPVSAYEFDELALLAVDDSQFLVQLSGIQNRQVLEEYLEDNALKASTWTYRTERFGSDWFVVVLNQSFDSLAEANNAIAQLPDAIRVGGPFAKRASQAKQEIN